VRPRSPALGHEIVDAAQPFRSAGISSFCYRRILDLASSSVTIQPRPAGSGFSSRCAGGSRRGADVSALVGDDQGALERPVLRSLITEIGRPLHRARTPAAVRRTSRGEHAEFRWQNNCPRVCTTVPRVLCTIGVLADRLERQEIRPACLSSFWRWARPNDRTRLDVDAPLALGRTHASSISTSRRNAELSRFSGLYGSDFVERADSLFLRRRIIIEVPVNRSWIVGTRAFRLGHGQPAAYAPDPFPLHAGSFSSLPR